MLLILDHKERFHFWLDLRKDLNVQWKVMVTLSRKANCVKLVVL